jgi:hypothetical protein
MLFCGVALVALALLGAAHGQYTLAGRVFPLQPFSLSSANEFLTFVK